MTMPLLILPLGNCSKIEMSQPFYSPGLMPADFFLFPNVKTVLKGSRFEVI
jgi:hypothetical protein